VFVLDETPKNLFVEDEGFVLGEWGFEVSASNSTDGKNGTNDTNTTNVTGKCTPCVEVTTA
jgi:hypothetical protein